MIHQSALYKGTVCHARVSPANHTFSLPVWMVLLNLSEAAQGNAFKDRWIINVDGLKRNLFCWLRSDHFTDGLDNDLEACVRRLVYKHTGCQVLGSILLLTNLRCFGFVFNPVSIYYCMDESGQRIDCVVLEVSNTPWLEKRIYVLPFFDQEKTYKFVWKKDFHVSPFFDTNYDYDWTFTYPVDQLRVNANLIRRYCDLSNTNDTQWSHKTNDHPTIKSDEGDSKDVTFVVALELNKCDNIITPLLLQPFMTFSVLFYIHFHAFILYMYNGVKYIKKPVNGPIIGWPTLVRNSVIILIGFGSECISYFLSTIAKAIMCSVSIFNKIINH